MNSTCQSTLTDLTPSAKELFKAIFLALAVIATFLNGTIVGIFIMEKSLRVFHTTILLSLIISDLLVSGVVSPLSAVRLSYPGEDIRLCTINKFAFMVNSLMATSALSVSGVAYERCQNISRVDTYQQFTGIKRKAVVIVMPWLARLIIIPTRLFDDKYFTAIIFALYVLCYSLLISSYMRMVGALDKRVGQLRQSGLRDSEDRSYLIILRQNQKATRMIIMIIFAFILCTFGLFSYRVLLTINLYTKTGIQFLEVHGPVLHATALAMFHNSALNPIIYFTKPQGIRRALKRLLSKTENLLQDVRSKQNVSRVTRCRAGLNSQTRNTAL